jgi:phosphate transport system permease protein
VTILSEPITPLKASGNLGRRAVVSRLLVAGATVSALLAVAVLAIVVLGVASRGLQAISLHFVTKDPPEFGGSGGGIASAIVGSALIVALATVITVPIAVLCAIYVTEFAGPRSRTARIVRASLDLMQGLPTVVVGLFVFSLIVTATKTESGFAGAIALSIIMLPLVARSAQEVLLLVPNGLREAADALGVPRWRSVVGVILPAAMGGIVTGTILAVARAAGETAPLLIVDGIFTPSTTINFFGHGMPNIPVLIWTASEAADPNGFARAWGAALVLLAVILVANVGARLFLARSRARTGQ